MPRKAWALIFAGIFLVLSVIQGWSLLAPTPTLDKLSDVARLAFFVLFPLFLVVSTSIKKRETAASRQGVEQS